jgi:SAM-dependent methyltransferase
MVNIYPPVRDRVLRPIYHTLRKLEFWLRQRSGLTEPEKKIVSDAQQYWSGEPEIRLEQNAHWRGSGIFTDDKRWLALGLEHLRLYEEFIKLTTLTSPLKAIVEWGCGGGANAIHLAPKTEKYYGVDISAATLAECSKQLEGAGLPNFVPVLINAAEPEKVTSLIPAASDLFLSTYVFECFPSQEHGLRVLKLAYDLLRPQGMAIIQIKYSTADWKTKPISWNYQRNLGSMTTYRIEKFWDAAKECGFTPKAVTLVTKQPLVTDERYAYFILLK